MDRKSELWEKMFEESFKYGRKPFISRLLKKIVDWIYPLPPIDDDDEFFKKSHKPSENPQPEKDLPKLEGRIIDITPIILEKRKQIS